MRSLNEWRLAANDPEWEQMKHVWGGGKKTVDPNLVNKMKLKVESIKEQFVRELGDKKIQSFRDVPPHMRDGLAQAIVVATLKAFYSETEASGGRGTFDQSRLGKMQNQKPVPEQQPQQQLTAPAGWKG